MKILVTGGAGYLGCILVPQLLKNNFKVNVLDLFIYGDNVLQNHPNLKIFKGDIRDSQIVDESVKNCDIVIHLACISNDPSFELNPKLGKSINLDAFEPLVKICLKNNVKKFFYASSSSVYGIKSEKNVVESMSLKPLTDYSKYKVICEKILLRYSAENFITTSVRSATLCGFSPRQRLDVIINIFVNQAFNERKIKVFGGPQLRPNVHINDVARFYMHLIDCDEKKINKNVYNVGYDNFPIYELAELVKNEMGSNISIEKIKSDDLRSYHISSEKMKKDLNFHLKYDLKKAIKDLINAFEKKMYTDPLNNEMYFNIKRMQNINLL